MFSFLNSLNNFVYLPKMGKFNYENLTKIVLISFLNIVLIEILMKIFYLISAFLLMKKYFHNVGILIKFNFIKLIMEKLYFKNK